MTVQTNSAEDEKIQAMVGIRRGPYLSYNPVSATQIWQWCSAMGDNNPTFVAGEDQLAPPAMMQMWTMRDINDRYAPGSTSERPYQVFDDMTVLGYPSNVAVSYDIQFLRYLHTGEQPCHYTTVSNISALKRTALGEGYFVTEMVEYLTGEDREFARAFITYFQYRAGREAETSTRTMTGTSAGAIPAPPRLDVEVAPWQPDHEDLDTNALSIGQALPELAVPITHKLIVGGALATQDFVSVHHNVPAARAAGMPDIFMNILTTCGLSARYLGDWAGAGSRLRRMQFKLLAPNFPGDTMVMEGVISDLQREEGGTVVTLGFGGRNGAGYHTKGSAELFLPGAGE